MKQATSLILLSFTFITLTLLAPLIHAHQPTLGGTTERINLNSMGEEANGLSEFPAISADGRYVAFSSSANNLVISDTNGLRDIFVVDRETGLVERVNVSSTGEEANGLTGRWADISADGRFVTFYSTASNLIISDTNGFNDVFVHDRWLSTTKRVSVHTDGTESNGNNRDPDISANGQYIVFDSDASNLVSTPPTSGRNIYLHDQQTNTTELISINADGEQGTGADLSPSVSGDGRFVTFESNSTNLIPNDTLDSYHDIFVQDRWKNKIEKITWGIGNVAADGSSYRSFVSDSGNYIAFSSYAGNLLPNDTNSSNDIFVYDFSTGIIQRVSVNSDGIQGNDDSFLMHISDNGRFVTYSSWANNLIPNDTNNTSDAFIYDRLLQRPYRLSINSLGLEGNGSSSSPAMAQGGFLLVFQSQATNLVANDTNGFKDIFTHQWELFTLFFPVVSQP